MKAATPLPCLWREGTSEGEMQPVTCPKALFRIQAVL